MMRSRVIFANRLRNTWVSETVGTTSGSGTGKSEAAAGVLALAAVSAVDISTAEGFVAAGAGPTSECLSTIGNATIFALAMLPISPPYCPTLMAESTSA
jgi:hypothetical protein